jgi:hypothetical protein
MMTEFTAKRRMLVGAMALLVMAVVGFVYAAWTTNGSGSGYAKAGTAEPLTTVDVSASTPATLYPGGNGDVLLKVSNPNPYPVRVSAVSGNGAITPDSGHASCQTTGVTFTDQADQQLDVSPNSSAQFTLQDAAQMSNASDDGCQGATFTIPVSLTAASNAQ